ncbi:MAG TPA: hypothetical protein VG186_04035 [Solirubrobacteraceae bacterium]|nr:hypothetical protein [Solirubrobacteraceae bacterium]
MNNRGRLVVDVAVAVLVAVLTLILAPGLGVVAIIVGIVVVVCATSFGVIALVRLIRGQPVRQHARGVRRR